MTTNTNEVTEQEVISFRKAVTLWPSRDGAIRQALERFVQSRSTTIDAAMLNWLIKNANIDFRLFVEQPIGSITFQTPANDISDLRKAIAAAMAAGGGQNG